MKRYKTIFFLFTIAFSILGAHDGKAQESVLDAGIRIQRTINLYLENGISIQYSDKRLKPDRLYFGFSYVTSRLGSAIGSNAIKQDNYLVSGSWYFRSNHLIRPVFRLNTGYFHADYNSDVFDEIPASSFLLSPEAGVSFELKFPLKIAASFGINLITGDGLSGPGTLYPMFVQTTASWSILKK